MTREPVPKFWGLVREFVGVVDEFTCDESAPASLGEALGFYPLDQSLYKDLAQEASGSILGIGLDADRVLLSLAQAGISVVWTGFSSRCRDAVLRKLNTYSADVVSNVQVIYHEVTSFDLEKRFKLILWPSSGLSSAFANGTYRDILARISDHLAEGGRFAFDYLEFSEASAKAAGMSVSVKIRSDSSDVDGCFGVEVYPEYAIAVENSCWLFRDGEGRIGRRIGSRDWPLIDEVELRRSLSAAALPALDRRSVPGKQEIATQEILICGKRTDIPYPLWHPYTPMKVIEDELTILAEGKGCCVKDTDGNSYIDASGGLWSTQCGLGHSTIIKAITDQLEKLSYGTLFLGRANEPAVQLSRALVDLAPNPIAWAYLTGSGSESAELAIKLARMFFRLKGSTTKNEVAYFSKSYHGTYYGSLGVSGLVEERDLLAPLLPGLIEIQSPFSFDTALGSYQDPVQASVEDFERAIEVGDGAIAALILEPVFGSAGVIIPPSSFFDQIQRICRHHDVLLIVDEVATGFGRTGRWFACEHFGLEPDILLVGKGINSGYLPLGATLFSAEIGQALISAETGIAHGSSHNGNPACCAAAIATIDVIRRERLVERAASVGAYFLTQLLELKTLPFVHAVRGIGLMIGVEISQGGGRLATPVQMAGLYLALKKAGVLVYVGPSSIIFMPSLTISFDEIRFVVDQLKAVLSEHMLS